MSIAVYTPSSNVREVLLLAGCGAVTVLALVLLMDLGNRALWH